MALKEKCDVLLVFVNEIEKNAVHDAFYKKFNHYPKAILGDVITYHDLEEIGGSKVMGIQIEMGSTNPGASAVAISQALTEMKPEYLILVGIAFGVNPDKQNIGDILVSKRLGLYESRKIASGDNEERIDILRGDMVTASQKVLGKFRFWSSNVYWKAAPVDFELLVSGEKLIDHDEFKQKLLKEYPEAKGGEMEGAGAYAAAQFLKRDWIVVKAICDFADGTKDQTKKKNQTLAATNAANFVFHVLENGAFSNGIRKGKCKKSMAKKNTSDTLKEPSSKLREKIKNRVKENIIALLNKKRNACLVAALAGQLYKDNKGPVEPNSLYIAAQMVNMPLPDAVLKLDVAVADCICTLKEEYNDTATLKILWNHSVSMLGWLVLLGVDDQWVVSAKRRLDESNDHLDFIIPVKTGAGAEIAFSRLKQAKAILCFDQNRNKVKGGKGTECDGWQIEPGWETSDKVLLIKSMLWKQVMKIDPPLINNGFTDDMDIELNETILVRSEKGEHHYFYVDRSCKNNPLFEVDVYRQVKENLPDLDIFFIGTEDGMVAIGGERQLHARLREFFRNITKIRVKENV